MWEVSASFEPGSTDPRSARRWTVSGNHVAAAEVRRIAARGTPVGKLPPPADKRKPMTAEQRSRWSDVQEAKGREEMTFTSFPIRPTGIPDGPPQKQELVLAQPPGESVLAPDDEVGLS
jgi:hypothetical protein